jgi:hypothetical protein
MMAATEFELLGELEEELEEEQAELEPLFPRRPARYPSAVVSALKSDSAEYERLDFPEFESPAEILQKKLLAFREKVHLRPQDYRKLILTASLHPFPRVSNVIGSYPVPNSGRGVRELVIDAWGIGTDESRAAYDQILEEMRSIGRRKLGQEIANESKNLTSATESIRANLKRLKPILLEAAMLDLKELQTDPTAPLNLNNKFYQLGLRLVAEINAQYINQSDANEAHVVRLGWRFAEYANMLQLKDRAFKNEVVQERRRRQQLQRQEKSNLQRRKRN